MNADVISARGADRRGKIRPTPKGRQVDDTCLEQVRALLGDRPRRRDLLIEHLHLIQDAYRCLSAGHLAAPARRHCSANFPHPGTGVLGIGG